MFWYGREPYMIYLDYAANAPVDPVVLEQFCETERRFPGNPNSAHAAGQAAQREMARITDSIATLLRVRPTEIIYTSGATEANNLAIKGIAGANRHAGKRIISTPLEHSSVRETLAYLQEKGYEIDLLDLRRDGTVDLEQLADLLREDTVLVAVCAVDSELGTIQPLEEIKKFIKPRPNCHLHVDATQAIGRIPLSFDGMDTMCLAPHKFGGLNGSGLLLKRDKLVMEPLLHGGASTTIYRGGTPALALAASMETALRLALEHMQAHDTAVRARNCQLLQALARYPKVHINSPENAAPHILNLSIEGVKGTRFQQALSEKGVCVSVKSACSTDGTPSRSVLAVSHDRKHALSSWRISLSHRTTDEEIQGFLQAFDACYYELTREGTSSLPQLHGQI